MVDDTRWISEMRLFVSKSIQVTRPSKFLSKKITSLFPRDVGVLHS